MLSRVSEDLRRRGLLGHATAVEWATETALSTDAITTRYEIDGDGRVADGPTITPDVISTVEVGAGHSKRGAA